MNTAFAHTLTAYYHSRYRLRPSTKKLEHPEKSRTDPRIDRVPDHDYTVRIIIYSTSALSHSFVQTTPKQPAGSTLSLDSLNSPSPHPVGKKLLPAASKSTSQIYE